MSTNQQPTGRTDFGAEQALEYLRAYQASGLRLKDFTSQQGIDYRTLFNWAISLSHKGLFVSKEAGRKNRTGKTNAGRFVQVTPMQPKSPANKAITIAVTLPNGYKLDIPTDFDGNTITSLLGLLEGRSC